MKRILIFLTFSVLFSACDNTVTNPPQASDIIPLDSILVDIPPPLSRTLGGTRLSGSSSTISGDSLFEAMRAYIGFGEESAQLIRDVIATIKKHNLKPPQQFNIVGEDQRTKSVQVSKEVFAHGRTWAYFMEIRDQSGDVGFQFYWDRGPFRCRATLELYQLDRIKHASQPDLRMEIVVNNQKPSGVRKEMVVRVVDNPNLANDSFYVDKLEMKVWDKANIIEVMGTSNHPIMTLFDPNIPPGRSYCFVGRADRNASVGVAKLALPTNTVVDSLNLFTAYGIDSVLAAELRAAFPLINQQTLDSLLVNAQLPAYFSSGGFIQAGSVLPTNPAFTPAFVDLSGLFPYSPNRVGNLQISFAP